MSGGDNLFPNAGYALGLAVATPITNTTFRVYAVTAVPGTEPESSEIPPDCFIESIEIQRLTDTNPNTTLTVYLCRDEDGDIILTPGTTTAATQTITEGLGTSALGGAVFLVNRDYHFAGQTGETKGRLYVAVKSDVGEMTARIRVNWRGVARTTSSS